MNSRALVALGALAVVGCQSGIDEPGKPPPGAMAAASARAPRTSTVPITPMQLIAAPPPPVADVAAPWTLTASDGSGLQLTRVDARAVVEGPLAFTELHLYFHNPEDRTREGTFSITLPSGAAVSRFAMEIDGAFQEAEVVEKAMARRVYDDFLHRAQDPALLEKAAGNQFSAKVFPIPARADKHLVLSFSQELSGRGYTLPLRGLPRTARVDVALTASQPDGTPQRQTLREQDWQPDRDFVAEVAAPAAAVTAGALVVGALVFAPDAAATAAAEPPQQLTLLVDTSASRALGFSGYVASVRQLIAALRARYGDPLALQVIAFDQDSQRIFDGAAADYGDAQDEALIARGAAGASDLGQVVATLAAAKKTPVHRRVVVVSDGVVTAGPDTPALVAAIKALPIDRLDVVLAGGIRDERLAASLVRAGLPRAGDVHDLDRGVDAVAAGLGEPVLVDVAIEIPGATWVYPRTVPAARPGSSLMVYARMDQPTEAIDVVIGGTRRTIGLGPATAPLIERAVAGAELEEQENQLAGLTDATAARALRDAIAKRSIAARVLSSQTSMLVLETEDDYARYGIDRTALADILVVGPDGIEQTERTRIAAVVPPPTPAPPAEPSPSDRAGSPADEVVAAADDRDIQGGLLGNEAADDQLQGGFGFGRSGFGPGGGGTGWGTVGTGRYGTIGHGSGTGVGYGVGGGRGGMRGRAQNVPAVRIGQPTVGAGLAAPIVRRYIRRNIAKINYCYEKQLLIKPALAGELASRFTISVGGTVTDATVTGVDAEVASCVAAVIRAIEFPRPSGGAPVQVTYAFTLDPTGGGASSDPEPEPAPEPAPEPDEPEEEEAEEEEEEEEEDRGGPALTGKLADVMAALRGRKVDKALGIARAWHAEAPGDVLALVALGEALEAKKHLAAAARIYGSIIDLYSARADLRRFAGERLERLGKPVRPLVIDTYRRAVADRPDHVTGHRLLAYALVRHGDHAGAFAAILAGLDQKYPDDRFAGADRVLAEDAGMIAAAYLASGGPRTEVMKELALRELELATGPSTRFILYWETDANDVDFHIRDSRRGHAWYSHPTLRSGGELYADITTGYGPECFAIPGKPTAAPYRLSINYYEQGPMGYGMGLLQIQRFDGKAFTFEDRPFVIMTDHAFVDLGTFR